MSNKLISGENDFETYCKQNNLDYLLSEWDYNKNSANPCDYFPFTQTKVYWKCNFGHSFEMSIAKRSSGRMCNICRRESKTSFPEQSIYYYIKQCFPDAVNSYLIESKEIDIYIPSLKIGIEYDGVKWHKNIERDIEKNNICVKNEIILYRIREENLPNLDEHKYLKLLYRKDNSDKSLEEVIIELLKCLGVYNVIISLDLDRIKIYNNYILGKKESSFGSKYPKLVYLWDRERNGYITPDMVSSGSKKKFWWVDTCGHSFDMSVRQIVRGDRCPYCAGVRLKKGLNDLLTKCPNLVKNEWDFEKNIIKPDEVYYQSDKKVWWLCDKGHSYDCRISNKVKLETSCPYCSHRKLSVGETDLQTKYPSVVNYWDYKKNIKCPNEVFARTKDSYWFICNKGHSYYMSVQSWVNSKNSCHYCNGKNVKKGFNDFESNFPEISRYWDYAKNDKKPSEVSKGSGKKYWFKCDKGHSFQYALCSIPKTRFCPYCNNIILLSGFNDLKSLRPDLLNDWDYEKNDISPENIIVNSTQKIHWKCSVCGEEWYSSLNLRTGKSATKCPKCVYKDKSRSKKLSEQKSISIINLDTKEVFNSYKEAEEKTGVKASNISKAVHGSSKTAGGFRWSLYNE